MTLYKIEDKILIESYQKAVDLGLGDDFVNILNQELIRRNILTLLNNKSN